MSLRTRLLAVTLLTLAVGLGGACVAGNLLVRATVRGDERQRLDARLQAATASLAFAAGGGLRINRTVNDRALDSFAWIAAPGGRILERPQGTAPALTRAVVRLARGRGRMVVTGPDGVLLGREPVRVGHRLAAVVIASVSIRQLQALRNGVLVGSLLVAGLILLVAGLTVRRALAAALAPVERMRRDAESWSAHDLNRRFALGPPRDEIGALAATLDHLLARIAASRRHEQRFAAEVAHELRTPLAAIRGVAELNRDADAPAARAALRQIEADGQRIETTLDTLIAVARGTAEPAGDGAELAEVLAEFPDVPVRRPAVELPRVEGDPALIRQILAPLLENARRYAAGAVWLELGPSDDRITVAVRDDGPGVPAELGEDVFLPGVRGPDAPDGGAGLGLPLARRLAASCGAELHLGPGPGGHLVLSLAVVAASSPETDPAPTGRIRREPAEPRRPVPSRAGAEPRRG